VSKTPIGNRCGSPASAGARARSTRGRGRGAVCAALGLLGVLLACRGLLPSQPQSAREIFDASVDSVVRVDVEQGLGAGFVIDRSGLIATNLHVIDQTTDAQVIFRDGRSFPITSVRGIDENADLAIIEVAASDLRALRLGDSDALGVGDRVYAIGNPLGFDYSMSDGLVGGLREIQGVRSLQVSAGLAPGSSGGPILNDRGEVIGVARGIVPAGEDLGLATPVNTLKELWQRAGAQPAQEFAAFAAEREKVRESRPAAAAAGRQRAIPEHPTALLDGCSDDDLRMTFQMISEAIEEGAPVYNRGDTQGCYEIYSEAALDLNDSLSDDCMGGREALLDGLERARGIADPADKAWAMRDSFDGLIDVIGRLVVELREGEPRGGDEEAEAEEAEAEEPLGEEPVDEAPLALPPLELPRPRQR
jgi:serine protease Do